MQLATASRAKGLGGEEGRLQHLLRLAHDASHFPLEAFPVLPPLLGGVYVCR